MAATAQPSRIIVTGSSSGIGRALAARLVSRGHEVWGLARSEPRPLEHSGPGSFRSTACDVTDWHGLAKIAAAVERDWGRADGLVACAAIHGEIAPALQADPENWCRTVRANLEGTYLALRAFRHLLRPESSARRPKAVCFSGGGATKARPNFSAYGAAKTAIVRLVESIAVEDPGIDINAIAPGAISTRLTEEIIARGPAVVGQSEYDSALKQVAGDDGSLGKALGLVEWLLSPASDRISGRLLAALWDPWQDLDAHASDLSATDVYQLRRILPSERGLGGL